MLFYYRFFFVLTALSFYSNISCQDICNNTGVEVIVESCIGAGFFAELKRVIAALLEYDQKNLKMLTVDWSQEFFPYKDDPKSNGWDLYFDLLLAHKSQQNSLEKVFYGDKHALHDQTCLDRWVHYNDYFAYRDAVHNIMQKYLVIKKIILDEAEQFYNKNMKGHYCIGVHVRYSIAHISENPMGRPIQLEEYIQQALKQYKLHKDKNPIVFLACDSHLVIKEFQKYFNESQLVFSDAFRASGREEPHLLFDNHAFYVANPHLFHERKPGYFGGKTVLIDGIILSNCDVMIHSHSNVCDFATFLNPNLKSIFLPKGLVTKPCHQPNAPFHVLTH